MNLVRERRKGAEAGIIILCGFCWLGLFFGCASDPAMESSQARTKFQMGLEQASMNHQEEMIANFKEAVLLDPKNEQYRLHLAAAYFFVSDLQNAESEYLEIVKLNKESKEAYRQLGRLYMRTGDWDRAVKNFNEDLQRPGTPRPHQVYNWLALSYYNLGDFAEAERQWLKAIELKDNAAIRLNLALAYKDKERFDQALDSLRQAVALNPNFPQAHYEIAQLLILSKEMDQAVSHFKEVIRLAPKSEWAPLSRKYLELIQPSK